MSSSSSTFNASGMSTEMQQRLRRRQRTDHGDDLPKIPRPSRSNNNLSEQQQQQTRRSNPSISSSRPAGQSNAAAEMMLSSNDDDDDDDVLKPVGTRETKIEDFDILKTIGTGTFARVYLCRHRTSSQRSSYYAIKILPMHDVIRLKQVDHVKSEKNILLEINHPFLVDMIWHYKDASFLYMLFPYVCGGELFSYLRSTGRFSPSSAQFYTVEIVSALEYLHSLNIVYRDLKPENLLLCKDGHLRITDFGFAKRLAASDGHRTWTLCGTPEYLAPEIIQNKGHGFSVDWWALGVLIFEMLAGYPPFFDESPFGIYEKILTGKIDFPRHFEPTTKDLVKRLLVQDPSKRLGSLKNGCEDVKRHRWLKHVDWEDVYYRRLRCPIVPRVTHEGDVRNYDDYPEIDWRRVPRISEKEMRLFDDF